MRLSASTRICVAHCILPANVRLRVKEGDIMVDGETIIAEELIALSPE
ncbi:MAG: hypothetical protein SH857_02385 [Chitinophagales bacterium]|nr:hypothetical protein [Chitinophagales bacterium]